MAQSVLPDSDLKTFGLDASTKLSADKIQEYDIDTDLVKTFLSICTYQEKVGENDKVTGEIKYSYEDFWLELNSLVADLPETVSTESRERLTQLRPLNDVAYQLYDKAKYFVADGGVDKSTFSQALEAIENRVSGANTGSNQIAEQTRENTLNIIASAKKQLDSLYGSNSEIVKGGGEQ